MMETSLFLDIITAWLVWVNHVLMLDLCYVGSLLCWISAMLDLCYVGSLLCAIEACVRMRDSMMVTQKNAYTVIPSRVKEIACSKIKNSKFQREKRHRKK